MLAASFGAEKRTLCMMGVSLLAFARGKLAPITSDACPQLTRQQPALPTSPLRTCTRIAENELWRRQGSLVLGGLGKLGMQRRLGAGRIGEGGIAGERKGLTAAATPVDL